MNNKGFAITTILYGTLILFCFLLISLLGILASYRGNLEKLVENSNGARDIITMKKEVVENFSGITRRGLYCFTDNTDNTECKYISGS